MSKKQLNQSQTKKRQASKSQIKNNHKSWTKFTNMKTEYKFNEKEFILEKVGQIDLQELRNSHRDCDIQVLYNKYMSNDTPIPQKYNIGSYDGKTVMFDGTNMYKDKLEMMTESINYFDELRALYKIPLDKTNHQIIEWLKNSNSRLSKAITKTTKQKLEKENKESEVQKENKKENKQGNIQKDSQKNT